jgi:hypothetical protein
MKLFKLLLSALALTGISIATSGDPTQADIPRTGGSVLSLTNQVELLNPTGRMRPATLEACFCTGDLLTTQAAAQADVLFNDGSLMRVGEQSQVSFWPRSRQLRLIQGTSLLFVPPTRGRMLVHTPNAITGVQNNAAVIRYIPSSGLTLVMALADADHGTVAITTGVQPFQEFVLRAGQMAFIQGTGLQVVEFDLAEFYATSRLVEGLNPNTASFPGRRAASIAPLHLALLDAIHLQPAFGGSSPVLDPAVISIHNNPQDLFEAVANPPSPVDTSFWPEELGRYEDAPPGVVSPLPDMPIESAPQQPREPIVESAAAVNSETPGVGIPNGEP